MFASLRDSSSLSTSSSAALFSQVHSSASTNSQLFSDERKISGGLSIRLRAQKGFSCSPNCSSLAVVEKSRFRFSKTRSFLSEAASRRRALARCSRSCHRRSRSSSVLTATKPFAYSFVMNFTFSNCVSCLRDFYFRRFVFLPTRFSQGHFMPRMLLHGNPFIRAQYSHLEYFFK